MPLRHGIPDVYKRQILYRPCLKRSAISLPCSDSRKSIVVCGTIPVSYTHLLRDQLKKLPYGSSNLILRSSYQKTLKLLESFGLNLEQPSTKVQSLVVTMPTMEDIDLDPTLSITSDLEDYACLLYTSRCV